ncbi:MAG: hypothetical protein HGA45_41840, partial [Chloroflexales bacterium]|nr:hypothetical protein [Chloroflexales bacterium]
MSSVSGEMGAPPLAEPVGELLERSSIDHAGRDGRDGVIVVVIAGIGVSGL